MSPASHASLSPPANPKAQKQLLQQCAVPTRIVPEAAAVAAAGPSLERSAAAAAAAEGSLVESALQYKKCG